MSNCRYCPRVFGNAGARTNHERVCVQRILPGPAAQAAVSLTDLPPIGAEVRVKGLQSILDRGVMLQKIRMSLRAIDRMSHHRKGEWIERLHNGVTFRVKRGDGGAKRVKVATHETRIAFDLCGGFDRRVDAIAAAIVRALRLSIMAWHRGRVTGVGTGEMGPFVEVEHECGVSEILLASDRDGLWQEVRPRAAFQEEREDDAATEAAQGDVAEGAAEEAEGAAEEAEGAAEEAEGAAEEAEGAAEEAEGAAEEAEGAAEEAELGRTPYDQLLRKLEWIDELLARVESVGDVARAAFFDAHLRARVSDTDEPASVVIRRVEAEADRAASSAVEECRARLTTARDEVRETMSQLEETSKLATKAILYAAECGLSVPRAARCAKRLRR